MVPLMIDNNKRRSVMIQGTFRSNFLLFGVPLGLSIGGEAGAVLAAVVASFYVPVINMLSVISLYAFSDSKNKNLKSAMLGILKNPLIIGGVSGLVFSLIRNAIGFEIPTMLDTTLSNIKSTATPLAFLILGGDLINNNTRSSVGSPWDDTVRPREQKRLMVEALEPIKDRILCCVSGNHERRSLKDADDDPPYDIMTKLDLEDVYRQNA